MRTDLRSRLPRVGLIGLLLGTLAPSLLGPPAVLAGTGECGVRNVTQATRGGSLATMVRAARKGDRLTVRGTCLSRRVVLDVDLVIRGAGDRRAVLDARGLDKVLRVRRGVTVTLRHVVVTGGRSGPYPGAGGGIRNQGRLTLIDVVVRGNRAPMGGGIWSAGPLTLIDSVVRDNRAGSNGGGILTSADVTLIDSVVRENQADGAGGGIYNHTDQQVVGVITLEGTSAVRHNVPDDCFGTDAC